MQTQVIFLSSDMIYDFVAWTSVKTPQGMNQVTCNFVRK